MSRVPWVRPTVTTSPRESMRAITESSIHILDNGGVPVFVWFRATELDPAPVYESVVRDLGPVTR